MACPTYTRLAHFLHDRHLVEQSFRVHQLGIENRGAGGSSNGVVSESDELVIEDRAGAQTAHEYGHSTLALGVAAGLRTVLVEHVNHWVRRRAGKLAMLRHTAKTGECFHDFGFGGLLRKLH